MEFIAKIIVREKIAEENNEIARKNYNDPEHMKRIKDYQMHVLKSSFHFEDNMEVEITYEIKEEPE